MFPLSHFACAAVAACAVSATLLAAKFLRGVVATLTEGAGVGETEPECSCVRVGDLQLAADGAVQAKEEL